MYNYSDDIEKCLFNDNVYCDSEDCLHCYFHPSNRINPPSSQLDSKQLTIEDIKNEEK